jgi:glycosyltransferase involved in cell wall biosynthesis
MKKRIVPMRIVIDLQGGQSMTRFHKAGYTSLSFARAMARHQGAHEIIIALSGLFSDTIVPLRREFEALVPRHNIRVWYAPGPVRTQDPGNQGAMQAAMFVREAFLASLDPDLVLVTSFFEGFLDDGVTSINAFVPDLVTGVLLHGPVPQEEMWPGMAQKIQSLKQADFIVAASGYAAAAAVDQLGFARKQVVDIGSACKDPEVCFSPWCAGKKAPCQPAEKPLLAVVSPLPPERTGIADYTAALLPALAEYYHIDVVTPQKMVADPWITDNCAIRTPEWFADHAQRYDRVVYHLGNSPFHHHMHDLTGQVPGVVVLHDFFLGNAAAHRQSLDPAGRAWDRALYAGHGYGAVQERCRTKDPAALALKYPCNFHVVKPALGVMVHSWYARNLAQHWYPDMDPADWRVIPLVRTPAVPDPAARRKTGFDFGEGALVVCAFGMLGETKLNHRLVDAWLGSFLADDPDCYLVFVGENPDTPYGRALAEKIGTCRAKDRIRITGWVSHAQFAAWLQSADAAVQLRTLSRGETSAAVLDCMNHGLPVIVNAHGANQELPSEAVHLLEDRFTDRDLAVALESLASSKEQRCALAETAARMIRKTHSPDVCARHTALALEAFYYRAGQGRPGLVQALKTCPDLPRNQAFLKDLAENIAANLPDKKPCKTLFVDLSATCRNDLQAGIDRVARSQVLGLIKNPPAGFMAAPVYLTAAGGTWHFRHARAYTLALLDCPGDWLTDDRACMHPGDILFCPDLSGDILVAALQAGALDRIRQAGVWVVFTVFDLLPLQLPHAFPPGTGPHFHNWLVSVCRTADTLVCISRAVAKDLKTFCETDPALDRVPVPGITWCHLGADFDASRPSRGLPAGSAAVLEKIRSGPAFLMVGTIEPRKGHLQVIAAFDRLWQQGREVFLVIVGREGWSHLPDSRRRTIPKIVDTLRRHPARNQHLFWMENASDQYLEAIYQASACLIAASENEGFGLPLIEAAQHRLPVLARDIPVFREVAGDHAAYFSGPTPEELADAVAKWLDLYSQEQHPGSENMPWLTWCNSCDRLRKVLEDLVKFGRNWINITTNNH